MKTPPKHKEKELHFQKLRDYSKKIERLKPLLSSNEPEGKINKTPKEV
ncbi:hypothetical protein R50073_17900 [Maricurvus nonylphenolicus]